MQGQKSGIGSLPETLGLEHGYTSTESSTIVEQQICWNNYIRNNPQETYISPINTSDMYTNTNPESQNVSMWTMGESSSSSVPIPNQVGLDLDLGPETVQGWLNQQEPLPAAASMLSLGDVNMNITHGHNLANNNGHHDLLFVQNPSSSSTSYMGSNATSSNSTSFSANPLGRQLQSQLQLPSKRKAAESGQSSSSGGVGSSTVWRSVVAENPPPPPAYSNQTIIPRLGLGVSSSDNHTVENTSSRRNVRLRINTSRQQDPLPVVVNNNNNNNNNFLQPNLSGPFPSLRLNPVVDLRSAPPVVATTTAVENSLSRPILQLPALRRNLQVSSRWNRSSSSSRATNRSANITISGSGDYSHSRTNISDHPIFIQPNDVRSAAINGNGVAAIATRISSNPIPAASPAVPNSGPHRSSPHYHPSRRLSEILRRSLLSSIDSGAGGGQIGNLFSRIPPAAGTSSQEAGIPPIIAGHPRSSAYVARSVSAGSEGRGRLVSEIRNVLDLIRRGEGLRFEDVMLLDQSVFYGMADIHDRHRDMRLDIDNMSYEELLALEERIGNVNTGLTEETISGCLKKKKYTILPDAEPCCICQEEYKNGDDIGGLKCGHDFHRSCIKKWLVQKNVCPVCKSAAIATNTTEE